VALIDGFTDIDEAALFWTYALDVSQLIGLVAGASEPWQIAAGNRLDGILYICDCIGYIERKSRCRVQNKRMECHHETSVTDLGFARSARRVEGDNNGHLVTLVV
jgi:hypothetical protein